MPVKRPVPAMRAFFHHRSLGRASDYGLIGSWVAGALDSAWRADDQYLCLNYDDCMRATFWTNWGLTEYLDEQLNIQLIGWNRDLTDRHLVISLVKFGLTVEDKETTGSHRKGITLKSQTEGTTV